MFRVIHRTQAGIDDSATACHRLKSGILFGAEHVAHMSIGEIVSLKSDDQPMTIVASRGNWRTCNWKDAKGYLRSGRFPVAALKTGGRPLTLEELVLTSYEKPKGHALSR
jgi:Uncharacterized small protein (DUF2158)